MAPTPRPGPLVPPVWVQLKSRRPPGQAPAQPTAQPPAPVPPPTPPQPSATAPTNARRQTITIDYPDGVHVTVQTPVNGQFHVRTGDFSAGDYSRSVAWKFNGEQGGGQARNSEQGRGQVRNLEQGRGQAPNTSRMLEPPEPSFATAPQHQPQSRALVPTSRRSASVSSARPESHRSPQAGRGREDRRGSQAGRARDERCGPPAGRPREGNRGPPAGGPGEGNRGSQAGRPGEDNRGPQTARPRETARGGAGESRGGRARGAAPAGSTARAPGAQLSRTQEWVLSESNFADSASNMSEGGRLFIERIRGNGGRRGSRR